MRFDAINGEGSIRVIAADMVVVRPAEQDDIAAFPVAYLENNVFVLNFGQPAILPRLSSLFPLIAAARRDSSIRRMN
jgi:hypothetical protein